jgi:hypothetical protein
VWGGPPAPWGRGAIDPSSPIGNLDGSFRASRPPWSVIIVSSLVVAALAAAVSMVLGRVV